MNELLAPQPEHPLPSRRRPEFSVLIPAFEAAETIGEAIDSVLAQTYPATEIVICDDGSKEELAPMLAGYGSTVTVIRQDNRGLSGARNTAARHARCEFVVNLDADDLYLPDRLEAIAEAIVQRPDLDVVTTDATIEIEGRAVKRNFGPHFHYAVENQRLEILDRCFVGVHWAIRRSLFLAHDGYDESIHHAEDWELAIRLILSGAKFGLVDAPLSRYRLQQGSLSNQVVGMLTGLIDVIEKTLLRPDLSEAEREVLERRIEDLDRELVLARLREAVLTRSPNLRREALAVVRAPQLSAASRTRAILTYAFPSLARRILARRGRPTAAGLTLSVD